MQWLLATWEILAVLGPTRRDEKATFQPICELILRARYRGLPIRNLVLALKLLSKYDQCLIWNGEMEARSHGGKDHAF